MGRGWVVGALSMGPVAPTSPVTLIPSTSVVTGAVHSATTPSFTPAASSLLVVPASLSGSPSVAVTDTLGGLTWHQLYGLPSYRVVLFWAIAPSSPTAGTITLTAANSSTYFTVGDVIQVTSGFTAASPIAQSTENDVSGSGGSGTTTLTATLGSTATGINIALLAQSYDNTSPVAPGADPDFTHLEFVQGVNSFDMDVDTSWSTAQQSVTWTSLHRNSGGFWFYEGILIELQ